MHPALEQFLEEYQLWLNATKEKCKATQKKFDIIQELVNTNGISEEILTNLYAISHSLFQTGYLLMESHTKINNLKANYPEEDQKLIDSYYKVANRTNSIVRNILSYKLSFEKSSATEDDLSI